MPTTTHIRPGYHPCQTSGCGGIARSNIAHHCETCRKRIRASGDARQRTIRKPELRLYVDRAKAAVERGDAPLIRSSLGQIRDHLRAHCQAIMASYLRGQPNNRHLITACVEVLKVCKSAEPEEIALTVAGLHLMRRQDPRSFASDAGFWGQMVRQVRSLHGIAMGRTVTLATGKDRGWYKTLSLQATAMIATMLLEAYARFAAHVLTSEEKEAERKRRPIADLDRGFATER